MRFVATLADQMYAFFITVVAGASVGVLFDVYRLFRAQMRPKRWLSALCDVLYWVVVTPVVFFLLLLGNWGELRYYVLLGMALGLFVYFSLFSSLLLWSLHQAQIGVNSFVAALGRIVLGFFSFPVRLLGGIFGWRTATGFLRGGAGGGRRRRFVPRLRWRSWLPGRVR